MQLPIMDNDETTTDTANAGTRPRRSRQPKADRRVCIYRVIDGNAKEQGSFPEAVIGDPLERRLPTFLKEMFGAGEYKVDLRKTNGHFERSFPISIAETEPDRERVIDIEPDDAFDDEPEEYSFTNNAGQMTAAEVENLLLKERLKRLEEDQARHKSGSQSDTHTLISALEESRREQRELMMMMLNQSQKPQQDATLQAMSMLEKSFGVITKAKELSEEIAPSGSGDGDSGYLAGGAKLLDSLGRNAGTFLPILAGLMASPAPPPAPGPYAPAPVPQANQNQGEFTDLAEKISKKKENEAVAK